MLEAGRRRCKIEGLLRVVVFAQTVDQPAHERVAAADAVNDGKDVVDGRGDKMRRLSTAHPTMCCDWPRANRAA